MVMQFYQQPNKYEKMGQQLNNLGSLLFNLQQFQQKNKMANAEFMQNKAYQDALMANMQEDNRRQQEAAQRAIVESDRGYEQSTARDAANKAYQEAQIANWEADNQRMQETAQRNIFESDRAFGLKEKEFGLEEATLMQKERDSSLKQAKEMSSLLEKGLYHPPGSPARRFYAMQYSMRGGDPTRMQDYISNQSGNYNQMYDTSTSLDMLKSEIPQVRGMGAENLGIQGESLMTDKERKTRREDYMKGIDAMVAENRALLKSAQEKAKASSSPSVTKSKTNLLDYEKDEKGNIIELGRSTTRTVNPAQPGTKQKVFGDKSYDVPEELVNEVDTTQELADFWGVVGPILKYKPIEKLAISERAKNDYRTLSPQDIPNWRELNTKKGLQRSVRQWLEGKYKSKTKKTDPVQGYTKDVKEPKVQKKNKKLTVEIANEYMRKANYNKEEAMRMAKSDGYVE